MIRGGHLDVSLLGASKYPKRATCNWTRRPGIPAGIGGAMDLAVGAKEIVSLWSTQQEGRATHPEALHLSAHAAGASSAFTPTSQ